jgi:hypothetical protein
LYGYHSCARILYSVLPVPSCVLFAEYADYTQYHIHPSLAHPLRPSYGRNSWALLPTPSTRTSSPFPSPHSVCLCASMPAAARGSGNVPTSRYMSYCEVLQLPVHLILSGVALHTEKDSRCTAARSCNTELPVPLSLHCRMDSLSYHEIPDCGRAVADLVSAGAAVRETSLTLTAALDVLTAAEVRAVGQRLGLSPQSLRRPVPDVVSAIVTQTKTQRSVAVMFSSDSGGSGGGDRSDRALHLALRHVGAAVALATDWAEAFDRGQRLFFLESYAGRGTMGASMPYDLTGRVYPQYRVHGWGGAVCSSGECEGGSKQCAGIDGDCSRMPSDGVRKLQNRTLSEASSGSGVGEPQCALFTSRAAYLEWEDAVAQAEAFHEAVGYGSRLFAS